jgi:hypothetical protein
MVFSGIITFSYLIAILFGYELNLCNGIDEFGLHFLLVCYALTFVFGWILAGCLVKMKR